MSHPFGDLLTQHLHRKHGLSQSKLAAGVLQPPSIISAMCQGKRLTGPQARERVIAIIGWLHAQGALSARDEANALLAAAGMGLLFEREPVEARLIQSLRPPDPRPPIQPVPGSAVHRTNLPAQLTLFVGREPERAELTRLLTSGPGSVAPSQTREEMGGSSRLITLTGSGGVGKTRLAIEAGRALLDQFPDGVWMVELAALADPALLPRVTAGVFGLQEQAGHTLAQALVAYLEDKHALLILDNCEHLIQACAELAQALLRACPRLGILATSREALHLPGEVVRRVPSLSTPDLTHFPPQAEVLDYESVRLFIQLAALVQPNFTLSPDNTGAIARICHRLDGIPLALELAASRMQALSPHEIAARLDDRFRLLVGGNRTSLPRQQTLRATLDWSYDLLAEPEQSLLRRLAVFAGGWTAEAAEAVCADTIEAGRERQGTDGSQVLLPATDILPALLSLVNKSMVVAEPKAEGTRYRLLETIRQYAIERLEQAGEDEVARARNRHLDYFLARAVPLEAPGAPQGAEYWRQVDQAQTDIDEYRAALTWSLAMPVDDERGLQLAWALKSLWFGRGNVSEGRAWLSKALAKWTRPSQDRARALSTAALLAYYMEDYKASRAELAESVRLSRDTGDLFDLADTLNGLAGTTMQLRQVTSASLAYLLEANGYLVEALRLARQNGFQPSIGYALGLLGTNALMQANPNQARSLAEEALAIFQQTGQKQALPRTFLLLANCARFVHDWDLARTHLEQCVALAREIGDRRLIIAFLVDLALVAREQGDEALAARFLEECQAAAEQLRRTNSLPTGLLSRILIEHARTAQLQGDTAHAEALLHEGVSLCRASGARRELANALNALAAFALTQADVTSAARHCRESLRLAHQAESKFVIAVSLAGLAEVLRLSGHREQAARVCGAVAALGDISRLTFTLDLTFTSTDLVTYDRAMAAMCAQRDDPVIAAAWAEGEAMPLHQAVDEALRG